ncbi:hypothetical protein HZB78_04420 [Candidatus Collierbacteria bacterium]|nr:hypothetical protein [Candidatus Collierbacteria bacterium]
MTKTQELEIPKGHPVLNIVAEITEKNWVTTGPLAGKALRESLPNLTSRAACDIAGTDEKLDLGDVAPEILKKRIGNLISQEALVNVLAEVVHGKAFQKNESLMEVFLTNTLPKVLAISSLTTSENNPKALTKGLSDMARQAGKGTIKTQHPLCPPYNIKVNDKGLLSHADGSLHPTLGLGFASTGIALGNAFRMIADRGIKVDLEFLTYSGREGSERLVEIGQDVLDHYKGRENDMLTTLQSAFDDLANITKIYFGDEGFHASAVSIEETIAPAILSMREDFISRFRKGNLGERKFFVTDENQAMDEWLRQNLGVRGTGALMSFEEEEIKYRHKQRIPTDETVTISAFMELALYRMLQSKAHDEERLILGAETTADYQMAVVPHVTGETPAIIMGKPRDIKNPSNPLSIRQPFNRIKGANK